MAVSHFSSVSANVVPLVIASTGADTTLTTQQAQDVGHVSITLTAAKAIIFPSAPAGKLLYVTNSTGATHAVTVKVTGQTGIAVAATKSAILISNGTDFIRLTADA